VPLRLRLCCLPCLARNRSSQPFVLPLAVWRPAAEGATRHPHRRADQPSRCRPFWPTAFARSSDGPTPPPAAAQPQRTSGSAHRPVAGWANRWFPPSSRASEQTSATATPAAPLRKFRQLGGQGGELVAEFVVLRPESLNLLLLSEDQRSDAGWCCQPISFWNPSRRCAHHRKSLPEMQAGIKLASRVRRGRWAFQAIPPSEQIHYVCSLHLSAIAFRVFRIHYLTKFTLKQTGL
jgi:hypothetical protein